MGTNDLLSYDLVKEWPQWPNNYRIGNPTGIGMDSSQNIIVFHRAGRKFLSINSMPKTCISLKTILVLDRESGKILNSWGNDLFIMPHGLTVDRNNNIWVTDVGLHQVFKFSHDGKLLMKLGEAGVPANDSSHFNLPTDVAVTEDGSFYVSDGYGNNRIVKFSSSGQYLFEWGRKGNREGEFNLPHAIELDEHQNIYVADRENKRVQVFDSNGKFSKKLAHKKFGKISSIVYVKEEERLIVANYFSSWLRPKHINSDIIFFDASGNFVGEIETNHLNNEGKKCWYHNVLVDDQGSIYVTDILGNRIKKFKRSVKFET